MITTDIAFGMTCWWTVFDLLDADAEVTALVLGASMILIAVQVDRTVHSVITPPASYSAIRP